MWKGRVWVPWEWRAEHHPPFQLYRFIYIDKCVYVYEFAFCHYMGLQHLTLYCLRGEASRCGGQPAITHAHPTCSWTSFPLRFLSLSLNLLFLFFCEFNLSKYIPSLSFTIVPTESAFSSASHTNRKDTELSFPLFFCYSHCLSLKSRWRWKSRSLHVSFPYLCFTLSVTYNVSG